MFVEVPSKQPGSIGRIFHGTLDGESVAIKEIHKKDFHLHEVGLMKYVYNLLKLIRLEKLAIQTLCSF